MRLGSIREKLHGHGRLDPVIDVLVALAIGLLLGAITMRLGGYDPINAYRALLRGSLGSERGWADTLAPTIPLILTGLTFAIGVRAGLFNIGAEGQVLVGALAAVMVAGVRLPSPLHITLALLAAAAAGVLWSLPAALLKIYRGVHEVISTIMLNWIAYWLLQYAVTGPYVNPMNANYSIKLPPSERLHVLVRNTLLSDGVFVSVVMAVAAYIILWRMVHGYELRVAGYNPSAASYAGISVRNAVMMAFLLGGVFSGMAGALMLMSYYPQYAISSTLANVSNRGFDGIGVALVGRNHPLGIILSAIFFGILEAGARSMQIFARVPLEMVKVVEGIIVIAVAMPGLYSMYRTYRRVHGEVGENGG
jgi:ABC-type uncharacterized transport system permease subunit